LVFELPPADTVRKIVSMKRCQRNWINNHSTINFSGLVQLMLWEVIREKDPEYFEKYKHLFEDQAMVKQEVIVEILSKIKK
jgi:hypothetical protein